ncbi:MAG: hypothetical protein SPF21_07570 [Candidatus Methanomethylophilaceae archaeon]|nr:hypothetical protein [Candidatus Methanomethylophilaceae archaeon]
MSFAFDKPMIVRMMEPITAIVGVYFVYVFLINYDTELLASLGFLLLGILAIADGFILHLRRRYAWSLNLVALIAIALVGLYMFLSSGSSLGAMIFAIMAILVVSWCMNFTRSYFRDTA